MYKKSKEKVDTYLMEILEKYDGQKNIELEEVINYICMKKNLEGIDISEVDLEASLDIKGEVSGLSYIDENWGFILVNSEENAYRKRFTVLHELGHILMHHEKEQKPIVSFRAEIIDEGTIEYTKDQYKEYEANSFSAGILMPLSRIRTLIEDGYTKYDIANILGVSIPALEVRFRVLRGELIGR